MWDNLDARKLGKRGRFGFFGIIAREAFFINSHRMVGGAVRIGLFFDKWQLVCSRLWNLKFYISKLFCNFVLPSKNALA